MNPSMPEIRYGKLSMLHIPILSHVLLSESTHMAVPAINELTMKSTLEANGLFHDRMMPDNPIIIITSPNIWIVPKS